MGRRSRVSITLLLLAASVACTKVQARVPPPAPPPPALTMPAPPDPLVVPAPLVERTPPALPEPPPTTPKTTAASSSRTPDRVTPPVAPPPQIAPDPPQALQTTANVDEIERKAVESLDNAKRDLDRIAPQTLGKDAREQFENARRMWAVAQTALTNKNYLFAREMAGKAAAMASLLVKNQGQFVERPDSPSKE